MKLMLAGWGNCRSRWGCSSVQPDHQRQDISAIETLWALSGGRGAQDSRSSIAFEIRTRPPCDCLQMRSEGSQLERHEAFDRDGAVPTPFASGSGTQNVVHHSESLPAAGLRQLVVDASVVPLALVEASQRSQISSWASSVGLGMPFGAHYAILLEAASTQSCLQMCLA